MTEIIRPLIAPTLLAMIAAGWRLPGRRGMIRAREIHGERGWWAVDYYWFTLKERPGELFDMAGLDSLGAIGVIILDARVTLVPLRMKIYAPTLEGLKSSAEGHRPARAPEFMIEAVRDAAERSGAGSPR